MLCSTCGAAALAEVLIPNHPAVVALVCLTCATVLPVTEGAEKS